MTEEEWFRRHDAKGLVWHLNKLHNASRTKAGRRRLRLFCCACARQVWDLAEEEESRAAVVAAERFADGEISSDELHEAFLTGFRARMKSGSPSATANGGHAVHYATAAKLTEKEI